MAPSHRPGLSADVYSGAELIELTPGRAHPWRDVRFDWGSAASGWRSHYGRADLYSRRTRLTRAISTIAIGAGAWNETAVQKGSTWTTINSTSAWTVCVVSLPTLSAGPLGEAVSSPDMTENGAVKGDTISTISNNAASRPRALQRAVKGVMTQWIGLTRRYSRSTPLTFRSLCENSNDFV